MSLASILAPITDDMHRVDHLIRDRLSSEVAMVNEIGGYIVSAGGKRLRPASLLLVARALGCTNDKAPLLAVVIELIHTATLLHDDVVDHASLRRGRDTANAVWGNSGAVLSGDFLYSRSFQLMVEADAMPVMRVMADATNAIAEGEVLQLMNSHDPSVDEKRYLRVIELKTAQLFQAATTLGALSAEASSTDLEAMTHFGHSLGMAYQLVDDLLDYTADQAESGKKIGADIAEGKPTLPLIRALSKVDTNTGAMLRDAIEHGRQDDIGQVLTAVQSTDAIDYTRAMAKQYCDNAKQVLKSLPASPHRQSLTALTDFVSQRSA